MIMAKVCGPWMVVSLGLGGAGCCAVAGIAAAMQNKKMQMIMERDFRINSTD